MYNNMFTNITNKLNNTLNGFMGNRSSFEDIIEVETSERVKLLQTKLDQLASINPLLMYLKSDGIYGSKTKEAVMKFQKYIGVLVNGIVDEILWKKINNIHYLNSNSMFINNPFNYPGYSIHYGMNSYNIENIKKKLNSLNPKYPSMPILLINDKFDDDTKKAIINFQTIFKLPVTGIVGRQTWEKLIQL
ncbi:MAG: peptidoglycan-binding protein [Clostridia bacterium]